MGPILQEFKDNRSELIETTYSILTDALSEKGRLSPGMPLPLKITAQGGVGTAEEHDFLINHYNLDSVGWGTPFLLVPEATNVDDETLEKLAKAKEEDLYLSGISPLGVPFNSLRGNSQDGIKYEKIEKGNPGSTCPKQYLISNTDYTERPICSASRQFQKIKIKELEDQNLSASEHTEAYTKIVEKSCICVGLGTSALKLNKIEHRVEGEGVSICPGPNMAYFSSIVSLREMVDHIYGNAKVALSAHRPNMFMKELKMYIDHLKEKMSELAEPIAEKQMKNLANFQQNLMDGIQYYQELAEEMKHKAEESAQKIKAELEGLKMELVGLELAIA